jgi:hypothetical protein
VTQNRYYSNLAQGTFITNSGGLTASTTALIVQSTAKWPTQFPFTVRAEPGTSNEELMLVTSGSGTAGIPYQLERGFDNTNPIPHSSGVSVIPGFCQLDLSEPQQHINLNTPASGAHSLPASAWGGGTMQLIQKLAANSASIDFTSIPSTFSHLRIVYAFKGNGTGGFINNGTDVFGMQLNGSTTIPANWAGLVTRNAASSPTVYEGTTSGGGPIGGFVWNNNFGSPGLGWGTVDFPFYSVSGSYKGYVGQSFSGDGGAAYAAFTVSGSYQVSSAISQILMVAEGSSTAFTSGYAWLYGIL